ncbi:hypothetical protein ABZ502_17370 [Streptomyces abikoensis]|uniref:hypothetical protein n=1 Tax=Streptomyces abikoensis TaxID=97398 RepID=UPI0033D6D5C4
MSSPSVPRDRMLQRAIRSDQNGRGPGRRYMQARRELSDAAAAPYAGYELNLHVVPDYHTGLPDGQQHTAVFYAYSVHRDDTHVTWGDLVDRTDPAVIDAWHILTGRVPMNQDVLASAFPGARLTVHENMPAGCHCRMIHTWHVHVDCEPGCLGQQDYEAGRRGDVRPVSELRQEAAQHLAAIRHENDLRTQKAAANKAAEEAFRAFMEHFERREELTGSQRITAELDGLYQRAGELPWDEIEKRAQVLKKARDDASAQWSAAHRELEGRWDALRGEASRLLDELVALHTQS